MFVYLLMFCWVLCIEKQQPPLLVSYRETSSSISSFIDSGGPLKPLGGMPLLWACVWDLPTKGLPILFQELMISLWCLSAVLQALWCCSSKSHHCPFFSSAPRHPKYISFPISTPSQAKHKPVSCAATQKAGTPDTHSSPPSQEWSLQGRLVLTAEPHQSLQALVPNHASSTNTPSQGRGTSHSDSPQKAGTSGEPSTLLFPYCPWWGNSRG